MKKHILFIIGSVIFWAIIVCFAPVADYLADKTLTEYTAIYAYLILLYEAVIITAISIAIYTSRGMSGKHLHIFYLVSIAVSIAAVVLFKSSRYTTFIIFIAFCMIVNYFIGIYHQLRQIPVEDEQ